MITEGAAAILLETTRRAFGNQSQSKQRSTLVMAILYFSTDRQLKKRLQHHSVYLVNSILFAFKATK